jgi:4-carboxymuconolactone decarboxylase
MTTPRIPPARPDEWTDAAREMFTIMEGEGARSRGSISNVVNTLAHNPEIGHPFLVFSKAILDSKALSLRVREIAILRVAHLNACEYEWKQHVRLGERAGLETADFEAVQAGSPRPAWSALEGLAMQAADQLCENGVLDDALWTALSEHLDRSRMLFLLFVIGAYSMYAWLFNSVGVEVEESLR